ncbi:ScbA/BarX family gamma-butyrolactone biosynthesis protein [Streptomyces sp. V4-01]|uniref:ScbA/BarX family gamma-butyrolactone biosynthesis protein n=1 Tax=Actinacidiphila polyblastidii TaxID=3110430 RepID=A0ABU7PG64_9ACTN|nr:ScbA/BarX family gamma-butyrolactone biosynthesis protein [Streptomyces sp. V4-01]
MRNSAGVPLAPDPAGDLSWSRTVPRELVHRSSVAEVLLTDVRPGRAGTFRAAACWPRSHATFPADGSDRHSPLLVVETLRQLGIYLPLRWYGVPPTSRMLIDDLYFAVHPGREPQAGHGGTEITCAVEVSDPRQRSDGTLAGLRLSVAYRADGHLFARAGGGARFLPDERYTVVRGDRLGARQPPPAPGGRPDPALLGVARPADVVVARRAGALAVEAADPHHPFYFDHASDHVPGMVLLEAARQGAAEASGGALLRPVSGRLAAARFTEYDPPARLDAIAHHRTCVFRVQQQGAATTYGVLGFDRHGT